MISLYNVIGIIEMKKCNFMLEIDILRNSSQKSLGVLRPEGCFLRGWVSKKKPRLPAGYKTMVHRNQYIFRLFIKIWRSRRRISAPGIPYRARNKGVPGAQGSLEWPCGSLKFLQGAQRCIVWYTKHLRKKQLGSLEKILISSHALILSPVMISK